MADTAPGGGGAAAIAGPRSFSSLVLDVLGAWLSVLGAATRALGGILAALAPYALLIAFLGVLSIAVTAFHVPALEAAEYTWRCAVAVVYDTYEPLLDAFVELYELLVCWSNSFGLLNRLLSRRVFFGALRECPAEYDVSAAHLVRAVTDLLRRYALALGSWLGTGPIANVLPLYTVADALQQTAATYAQALVCLCEVLRPLWDWARRVLGSAHLACAAHQLGNAVAGSAQALLGWGFRLFQAVPGIVFNGTVTLPLLRDAILLGSGPYAPPNPLPFTERAALGGYALAEFANDVVGAAVCTAVAEIETGGESQAFSDLAFAACMAPSVATCGAWSAAQPAEAAASDTCADPAAAPVRRLNWFGWVGALLAAAARAIGALIQLFTHAGLVLAQFFAQPAGPRFLDSSSDTAPSWQIDAVWDTLRAPAALVGPSRLHAANAELYPLDADGSPPPPCNGSLTGVPRERIGCDAGCTPADAHRTLEAALCELADQLDDLLEPTLERRLVGPLLCCLPRALVRGAVAILKFALDAGRAAGAGVDRVLPFLVARSRWTAVVDELIGPVPALGGVLQCVCALLDALDHRLHCVCVLLTHPLKAAGETLRLAWEAIPVAINTALRLTALPEYEPAEPALDELYCLDRTPRCYDLEWRVFRWLRTPRPIGEEFTVITPRTITTIEEYLANVTVFPGLRFNISTPLFAGFPPNIFPDVCYPPTGTYAIHYYDLANGSRVWLNPFEYIEIDSDCDANFTIPSSIDGVDVLVYALYEGEVVFVPEIVIETTLLNITTFERDTGMPSFAYVPKGTACSEPTTVAAGPADALKLALVPVGLNAANASAYAPQLADLARNGGGWAEIVWTNLTLDPNASPETLRLVEGARAIDNWHSALWSEFAELFLESDAPGVFGTETPLLVVNGTLQYALVPTPLLPGGARLALRECGFVECLCRILSVGYLNEFLPADAQLDAAAFPDLCCGLEAGLRALVEAAKTVAEFFLALLQTYVDAVNADPPDVLLRWVSCTGSGVGQTGPPAVCSPLPFLQSDLDDFLGCPCDVIDTLTIAGRPIPCLCTLLDNVALGASDLVRAALVLASATTYSLECADADFPDPECTSVLEDRFTFAFAYVESALDYLARTGGGVGCVLGQLFAGATCRDRAAGNFGGCPDDSAGIDLDACSGPQPAKVDPESKACFLGFGGSITVDDSNDASYQFGGTNCGCTPVYRFQRLFESAVDVLAVLIRAPLRIFTLFVDALVTGSNAGFNFQGPTAIRNLLREITAEVTVPLWGRKLNNPIVGDYTETERDYGFIQQFGFLLNCLLGPDNCKAPGDGFAPCSGNFFIVLGNTLREFSQPFVDLVTTVIGALLGFFVNPGQAIDLFIGIFTNEIPCIVTAIFSSLDQLVDFAVEIVVALVRLIFGEGIATIVEFILVTVTDAILWFVRVIQNIVDFLAPIIKKRGAQVFEDDAGTDFRALFRPDALADGVDRETDFCVRVLRAYGDSWDYVGYAAGSGLTLEQEFMLRACYGATALPQLWNAASRGDRVRLAPGAEPVPNPWAGAPTLPPDLLTNATTALHTTVDVVRAVALYAQYRRQRGNLTTLFVDAPADPAATPVVYQNLTRFEELALAHGIDPAASLGVAWVRYFEDRVERSVVQHDIQILAAAARTYLLDEQSPLQRAVRDVQDYGRGLKRAMHETYAAWQAAPPPRALPANASVPENALVQRWTALRAAASAWYDAQTADFAAKRAALADRVRAYAGRHAAGSAHLAQRLAHTHQRYLPEGEPIAEQVHAAAVELWDAATADGGLMKRQVPCDPFADDANCTQCEVLDTVLSEGRRILEFCYQVELLNNTDFIEPVVTNVSLCVAPQDPANPYAGWYNVSGAAEGTLLRGVLDWATDLLGCDVLLSPVTYLFNLNDDPTAGPTGFLYDFLPFYGRCDRDAHLRCQRGAGVGAGLLAALFVTGGLLVIFAFVAPPLASIWNLGLSLLGLTTVFLVVFAQVAWGYSARCASSPSGLLTTYVLPVSVPTVLLPACAARELKDFADGLFAACWSFLEPLVVNGTDPCPACPAEVQLIDEGCAAFGLSGGAAGFGYYLELVGLGDVVRVLAQLLPFVEALFGFTDAIGGPYDVFYNATANVTVPDLPPVCQGIAFVSALPYFVATLTFVGIVLALLGVAIALVQALIQTCRGANDALMAASETDDGGAPARPSVPRTFIDERGRTAPMYIGDAIGAVEARLAAHHERVFDSAPPATERVVLGVRPERRDPGAGWARVVSGLVDDSVATLRQRRTAAARASAPYALDDVLAGDAEHGPHSD